MRLGQETATAPRARNQLLVARFLRNTSNHGHRRSAKFRRAVSTSGLGRVLPSIPQVCRWALHFVLSRRGPSKRRELPHVKSALCDAACLATVKTFSSLECLSR